MFRRSIIIALVLALALSVIAAVPANALEDIYEMPVLNGDAVHPRGDADSDGEVTILDATRVQRYLAGLAGEAEIDKAAADADADGDVTILDATRVQRVLAGLCDMDGNSLTDPVIELPAPVMKNAELIAYYIAVSWDKVEGADYYRVFVKGGIYGSWTEIFDTDTNYVDIPSVLFTGNTEYSFTVCCIDGFDGDAIGPYDDKGVSVMYYDMPEIIYVENTDNGMWISWNEVEGVAAYRVFYYDDGWHKLGDFTGTGVTVTGLTEGEECGFTVRGLDSDGSFVTPYKDYGMWYEYHSGSNYGGVTSFYQDHYLYALSDEFMLYLEHQGLEMRPNDFDSEPLLTAYLGYTGTYADPSDRLKYYMLNEGKYRIDLTLAMMERNDSDPSDYYFACSFEKDEGTGEYYYYMYIYEK